MLTKRTIQHALFREFSGGSLVIIPNYTPTQWRECDIYQVTKSRYPVEFQIKISVVDFRADRKKGDKHDALNGREAVLKRPRRFWYVMPEEVYNKVRDEIPDYAGVMLTWGSYDGRAYLRKEKPAPNLRSEKVAQSQLDRISSSFYYRFWKLRGDIDDMKRSDR